MALTGSAIVRGGAIIQYQKQTENPSASFTATDIIKPDRDIFLTVATASFNGSSGVGMGTKSAMNAITPTKIGVGYWVTDEGSWNTTLPANTSGQLYTWNGSVWTSSYTPYTYPYPDGSSSQRLAGYMTTSAPLVYFF